MTKNDPQTTIDKESFYDLLCLEMVEQLRICKLFVPLTKKKDEIQSLIDKYFDSHRGKIDG